MMHHLLCCIRNGEIPHRDFTPPAGLKLNKLSPSPGSVQQPELDPKTLQPKIVRTPEKLRKSPPKNQSPMKNKIVKTPSPVKRRIFNGIHKSRSKSKVSAAEMEALYREGVEMLMVERGQSEGNGSRSRKKIFKRHSQMFSISSFARPKKAAGDSSSHHFGHSYDRDKSNVQLPGTSTKANPSSDWVSALDLDLPNEPEKQSKPSSEFGAEIVIPIRGSSRGFSPVDSSTPFVNLTPKSTATSPKTNTLSPRPGFASRANDHSPLAHKRMSSQGTELALDLAPDALMSQLCLDFLDSASIKLPDKPLLRPYEMPSITSSFTDDLLSTPLRKVSSTLSTRVHSRAPSSDYGSDPGVRVLRHSRSDTIRRASWSKPPVPVPTQEKTFFRSHRDNGLVSPSSHADGTPAFLAGGLKDLPNGKDLSPIKEVNSPQRTPGLEHVNKTLSAWKLGQDEKPATPTSVMLQSILGGPSEEHVITGTAEAVDGSSSRYPSQPPSRHDSCFQEWIATPSKETPPLPALDNRVTSQNAPKGHIDTPRPARPRSYSIGASSTKSASSVRDGIVRRSLSKVKRGFGIQKASGSETIIPMEIPMFPETKPLRPAASLGTLGSRRGHNMKASGTTSTTIESFKFAAQTLRRANSIGTIASVRSSESLSPGSTVHRSYAAPTNGGSRSQWDTRSTSMFSEDSYYSPSQSPCPRDTGGSWTKLYDDCVSNPYASCLSVNRRTIDFQNMNMALHDLRSSTVSPSENINGLTPDGKITQAKLRPKSCNVKAQSVKPSDAEKA